MSLEDSCMLEGLLANAVSIPFERSHVQYMLVYMRSMSHSDSQDYLAGFFEKASHSTLYIKHTDGRISRYRRDGDEHRSNW